MTDTAYVGISGPIPLAGIAEIHDHVVKISRQGVEKLTFRSDFPRPAGDLAAGAVWLLDDVKAWLDDHADVLAEVFKHAPLT
jgi:prophage regulatory protein